MFGEELKLFGIIDFGFADLLDIVFVSIVFYYVFLLFRGTRAVQMFAGFCVIALVYFFSILWDMKGINWIFSNMAAVGVAALVIVFQPEIRGALVRLGQLAGRMDVQQIFYHANIYDRVIGELIDAARLLSRDNYGALIVVEQQVGLKNYTDTGETIDSVVSSRLLRSLFFPNSPLHDGAVIIARDRIISAGCVLPVQSSDAPGAEMLGMRHRAAKALASESDAIIIVVSEETGAVSLAYRNVLRRKISYKELEEELRRHLNG